MTEPDLRGVLAGATDRIEPPRLAGPALVRARRRRARQAGALGVGGAVLAVVTVLAVVNLSGPPPSPQPSPAPGTPNPSPSAIGRAVPDDVIQPLWDPMSVTDLPWADNSPLPRELAPSADRSEVSSLLVALSFEDAIYGFGPGQARTAFSLPEPPIIPAANAALSADGTLLAFAGDTAIWSRSVQSGESWTRVDYPAGFGRSGEWGVGLTFGDDHHVLLQEHRFGFTIDLRDGSYERIPKSLTYFDPATAADGKVVATTFVARRRTLGEYDNAELIRAVDSTALHSLTGLSVGNSSIAAVRGVGSWTPPKEGAELNGLIAIDRESFLTRAYLPIRDPNYSYTDAGRMRTVAWLDDDTALVDVTNFGDVGVSSRHLFSWNVESGDLRRVADLPHEAPLTAAAGAFG